MSGGGPPKHGARLLGSLPDDDDDDDGDAKNHRRHPHSSDGASRPPPSSSRPSPMSGSRIGSAHVGTGQVDGAPHPPQRPPLPSSSSSYSFSVAEALREHRRRRRRRTTMCSSAAAAAAAAPPSTDHRRPIDVVAVILAVSNLELVGENRGSGNGGGSVSLLIGDPSLPAGVCARIVLRGGEATSAVLGGTMNVGDVFRFNRLTVRRDYCRDEHDLPPAGDEDGGTAGHASRLNTPRMRPRQTSQASGHAGEESVHAPDERSASKQSDGGGEAGGVRSSSLATPAAAATVAGGYPGGDCASGAKRLRVTPSPAIAVAAARRRRNEDDATSAFARGRLPGWGMRQLPDVVCEFGHSWLDPEAGPSFVRLGYCQLSPAGGPPITLTPQPVGATETSSPAPSSSFLEGEEKPDLDSLNSGVGHVIGDGAAVVLSDPDEVPIGMAVPSRLVRGLLDWYRHLRDGRNGEGSRMSPGAFLQPQQPPRSIGTAATCGILGGVNLRCQNRRLRRLRDAVSSPNLLSDVMVRVESFHRDGDVGSYASFRHRRHRGRPHAPVASYAAIWDGPKEEDHAVLVVAATAASVGDNGQLGKGDGGAASLAAALEGAARDGGSSWVVISAVLSRRASSASAAGPTDGGCGGRDDLVLVPTSRTGLTRYSDGGEGGAAGDATTTTCTPMPQPWPTHTPSLTMERAAAPTAFAYDSCPTPSHSSVLERREVRSRLVNVFIDDVGSSLVGGRGEQAITPENLVRHIVEGGTSPPLATDAAPSATTGTDGEERRRYLVRPRYRGATLALDEAVPADCCVVKADGAIVETLCGNVSANELVEEAELRFDDVDGCQLSEQVYNVLFGMISEGISLHWTIEKRRDDAISGDGNGWHVIGASLKRF